MANKRRTHRSVVERILVRGTLVLESPAHFGSGERRCADRYASLTE